jgi:hypothetical protein
MAVTYLVLDEAARMLGISPDELNQLRQQLGISAYRDGSSWKFKAADIERLARERSNRGGQSEDDLSLGEIDDDLSLSLDDEPSVAPAAAVPPPLPVSGDSDELGLSLDDDLGLPGEAPGSAADLAVTPADGFSLSDDDLSLSVDDDLSLSSADAAPVADGSAIGGLADDDLSLSADDDLKLGDDLSLSGDDDLGQLSLASGDDLSLGDDDDLSLAASDAGEPAPAPAAASASSVAMDDSFELAPGGADAAEIDPYAALAAEAGDDDDDDISLGDEISLSDDLALGDDEMLGLADDAPKSKPESKSKASELTLNTGDSDIELLSDADSADLKLGGDDPLGLDDGDALSSDLDDDQLILSDDSRAIAPEPTPLSSAEDFQLTPFSEVEGEPSESGSQVIALDSGEDFADMGGALAASGEPAMASMLEEDMGAGPAGGLAAGGLQPVGAVGSSALAAEAPWGGLEMTFLIMGALLLLVTGMMMFDLMRNLGAWGSPMSVNKTLMDTVLGMLGM